MSRRARERQGAHHAKGRTPGPVHLNAMHRAMVGASLLPRDDVARVAAGLRLALDEFSRGVHCSTHWRCLADATNVAECLAELRICSDDDSRECIQAGQAALAAVADRHTTRQSWALRADELLALRAAVERHHIQLTLCSFTEYERAIAMVRNRVAQAVAGNAPKGCRVVAGEIGATA